jgi:sulfate adenylyltransferase subunit 1
LTSARITGIHTRRDIHELASVQNEQPLALNEIGQVSLQTREALAVDEYAALAATGSFILIDEASHQTAAAGMLLA